jgi:glycosyltransferase involved in cell wall biosynthesis
VRVLVVIPSYNEERALPGVLEELRQATRELPHQIEALVVDDGSSDGTAAVARAHGARVISLCSNLGIGGAVQTGLRVAYAEGFDCAAQVDGDGQHICADLGAMLERLSAHPPPDLLVGSRFLRGDGFQSTALRRAGKLWLSGVLRLFCGLQVSDPTSGFRVFGPRALALFHRAFPFDFPEAEVLATARACGLRIAEVPVTMRERQSGRSSIRGLLTAYYLLKVTAAIILDLLRVPRQVRALETSWTRSSAATGSSLSSASPSPPPSSASSRGST